jgi:TolB-like protein
MRTLTVTWFLISAGFLANAQDKELAELAGNLRTQIVAAAKIKVVAFWEIRNSDGFCPDFSNHLVDELGVLLTQNAPGFRVVTRTRLDQLLQERRLTYATNFENLREVGKFSGADAIVAGSFQVLSSSIRLVLQVLNVGDASIVTGATANLPRTRDLETYIKVCNNTPQSATTQPRAAAQIRSDQGVQGGFGPLRRMPSDRAATKILQTNYGQDLLRVHHCENHPEVILCAFSIGRGERSQPIDLKANAWYGNKLVDTFGDEHKYVRGYFLTGRGEIRQQMNVGPGEFRWLVQEFDNPRSDLKSVKVVNTVINQEVRDIPVE